MSIKQDFKHIHESASRHITFLHEVFDGVDEKFQQYFVINISYCVPKDCITNNITL